MNYQLLGKSALEISEISAGCMSLKSTQPGADQLLHKAVELGINLFDTADLYDKGENEMLVGKALKSKRQKVIIATKVGNQWRNDGSGWDWNPQKSYILSAVEGSLRRLQTDYIDLYQLHGGTIDDPIDETIEAFEILKEQGKIRYYGISSIRPNVIREYVRRSNIVSVMMQYSLLDRRPEESCLSLLKENAIGVLARGSVAQGILINKPVKGYLDHSEKEVEKAVKAVRFTAGEKRTSTQTALGFVLKNPAITSAVVGIRTQEHLYDCVRATKEDLSDFELNFMKESIKRNVYSDNR